MLNKKPTKSRELLTILAFSGFIALAAGSAQSPETEKTNTTSGGMILGRKRMIVKKLILWRSGQLIRRHCFHYLERYPSMPIQ